VIAGLEIRAERSGDEDAIRAIHDAAFGETDEGRIVDRQRATSGHDARLSLVAEVDGAIVGHCLLSRCPVEGAGLEVLALGPIAVRPDRQGHGIGGSLVRAAVAEAERRGSPAVVLLGHPTYYPRFGFEPARPLGLEAPAAWPDAAWMACRLSGWFGGVRGVVRYPEAFEPL
jgi:putative acetyltransferase